MQMIMSFHIGYYVFKNKKSRRKTICKQSLNHASHFFHVVMQEGSTYEYPTNRWAKIKFKIKLCNYLDEYVGLLWDLLEEFQDVFAWHKGELGHCTIGEHAIDT
jgi:hypothetical protein